ncbi:MAG: DUF190 domain-containing protein [Chlorobiaceae bacterium]|jgi:uncharacterized protein|nr:DUF190 domain-containing protein [Chlorobiaceae bacterium]
MMELRNLEQLRIFVGEQVKFAHRPLYEAIVHEALAEGLAGATVQKGVLSYGHHQIVHTAKVIEYSVNLPMVIELVDTESKIEAFFPVLERMVRESGDQVMVTRERVRSGIIE